MALKYIKFKNDNYGISYTILNPKNHIDLIILHGWGSNKNLMKNSFNKYMDNYRHIYIDIVGFGSSFIKSKRSDALKSIDFALILDRFLDEINSTKDIIIGHSFGGKIATLLNPKLLVLLSSSGILLKKKAIVRVKIYLYKALRDIFKNTNIKKIFISKDAINLNRIMYESFKIIVNEDFEDIFKKQTNKTLIFWGAKDKSTPTKSGFKIFSLIDKSSIFILDGNHYFFLNLNNANFISNKIKEYYANL